MKKIVSLLLTAVMLAAMLSVFALPASAVDDTTVMKEYDTCTLNLKNTKSCIEFTSPYNEDYTFISNITEDASHRAKLIAILYCGSEKVATDFVCSAGNGNFCISYGFKAGKTYRLEIQLKNAVSCSVDVSLLKEIKPGNLTTAYGKCIISKPGTCELNSLNISGGEKPSTLTICRNTTVKVKDIFINDGTVEVLGKLDLTVASTCRLGEINVGKEGSLVEPDPTKFDYTYHDNVSSSTLSEGNIWIIIAIAVVAVGGVAAFIIVKKRKNKQES